MVGFLVGPLTGNDAHATQVGPGRWALHGGLGPKVNHSCDPNCGVRLNDGQAFDFVARQPIGAGQELTFDYAMRNFTIDHFPAVCLCGTARCRGSVTGWKDLPAARKVDYGEALRGADARRPARARFVGKAVEALLEEAPLPLEDADLAEPALLADLSDAQLLRAAEDDPRAPRQSLLQSS